MVDSFEIYIGLFLAFIAAIFMIALEYIKTKGSERQVIEEYNLIDKNNIEERRKKHANYLGVVSTKKQLRNFGYLTSFAGILLFFIIIFGSPPTISTDVTPTPIPTSPIPVTTIATARPTATVPTTPTLSYGYAKDNLPSTTRPTTVLLTTAAPILTSPYVESQVIISPTIIPPITTPPTSIPPTSSPTPTPFLPPKLSITKRDSGSVSQGVSVIYSGRVADQYGNAVSGATVLITDGTNGGVSAQVTTNADGVYTWTNTPGKSEYITFYAMKTGYPNSNSQSTYITVISPKLSIKVDPHSGGIFVNLGDSVTYTGSVTDQNGKTVPGATVLIIDNTNEGASTQITTNADGFYTWTNKPTKNYATVDFYALKTGYPKSDVAYIWVSVHKPK